jgi:hypothetical protein
MLAPFIAIVPAFPDISSAGSSLQPGAKTAASTMAKPGRDRRWSII